MLPGAEDSSGVGQPFYAMVVYCAQDFTSSEWTTNFNDRWTIGILHVCRDLKKYLCKQDLFKAAQDLCFKPELDADNNNDHRSKK